MPQFFSSEHSFSYKTYTFGYAQYAKRIGVELLDPIYDSGFLPYSGNRIKNEETLFYMARSARIKLSNFEFSSENRRVYKKFLLEDFLITENPAVSFTENIEMINFCLEYFKERHGPDVMTEERIKRILSFTPETVVVEYKLKSGEVAGYVIEIHGKDMRHYWFSFFDLKFAYSSFGMWLMLNRTIQAKDAGLKNYYLGTVYGDKALYKTNIYSLEYWNGTEWIEDVQKLKVRARTDDERLVSIKDEFKD